MTVRENLLMGAYPRSDRKAVADDLERMLTLFPRVAERINQRAGILSGGEQQMLAMARALMGRPRLICMDEPTMGLSPLYVDRVLELIAGSTERGHRLHGRAERQPGPADRHDGYVLQTGRIVLQGARQNCSTIRAFARPISAAPSRREARGSARSALRRRRRLAERQHEAIGPGEERRGRDRIEDREIVEPGLTQPLDMLRPEFGRSARQRRRGGNDRAPTLVELRPDALVEKAAHVVCAFGIGRRKSRMDRGAENAPVQARRGGGGEFALGARQAPCPIIENVLVRPGARL